MTKPDPGELPDLLQLVLAYAPLHDRGAWQALFALDTHLAALVRKASEPMLGQIRLAWWRDRLNEDRSVWPKGNPLLTSIAEYWGDSAPKLASLVDGWEHLLADPPIERGDVVGFANGRGDAMAALAMVTGSGAQEEARQAGYRWALADLAAHSGEEDERKLILAIAAEEGVKPHSLPQVMRPLAILDGLATRSIAANGAPLFEGRRAALVALRLGMFGR